MHTLYLETIHKKWRQATKSSTGRVEILSPYLTSRTAESIIAKSAPQRCKIYTVFSIEAFAARASSLVTIRKLHELKYPIYHVEGLHAKIVFIEGEFASIGSQNLTTNGIRNIEANVAFQEQDDLQEISSFINESTKTAQRITTAMIRNAELQIQELQELYATFKNHAKNVSADIFQKEERRIQQLQLRRERAAERKKIQSLKNKENSQLDTALIPSQEMINEIIEKLKATYEPLTKYSGISRELAERMIKVSALWDHPKALRYVRAPRHSSNIYKELDQREGTANGGAWFVSLMKMDRWHLNSAGRCLLLEVQKRILRESK